MSYYKKCIIGKRFRYIGVCDEKIYDKVVNNCHPKNLTIGDIMKKNYTNPNFNIWTKNGVHYKLDEIEIEPLSMMRENKLKKIL